MPPHPRCAATRGAGARYAPRFHPLLMTRPRCAGRTVEARSPGHDQRPPHEHRCRRSGRGRVRVRLSARADGATRSRCVIPPDDAGAGEPAGARTTEPSPRADTLITSAWLDLADGPVVLSVPETHGRYYVISLIDMWTNVFASIGAADDGHERRRVRHRHERRARARGRDPDRRSDPPRADRRPDVRRPRRARRRAPATASSRSAARRPCARPPRCRPAARPRSWSTGSTPRRSSAWRAGCSRRTRHARRTVTSSIAPGRSALLDARRRRRVATARSSAARGAAARRCGRRAASMMGDPGGQWRIEYAHGDFGTDYLSRAGAACAPLRADIPADALAALTRTDADGRALTGRASLRAALRPRTRRRRSTRRGC